MNHLNKFTRLETVLLLSTCVHCIRRVLDAKALPFYPHHLMCPISLDLMSDPVIVPSGISYDRDYITDWLLVSGTDPLTGMVLSIDNLISNRALGDAVEHYRHNHLVYNI